MMTKTEQKTRKGIRFYHPDHLGSTTVVTDLDGEVTQNVAYIPYGEVFVEQRNGTWNTPYLFNAKELDEETGLYYYGARYLDPTNVTWMSVDPMWENHSGVSPFNYCLSNPVKMIDPDGQWEENADGNLVAQKGDNAWTLAKYLNTTPEISVMMLKEQGYKVNKKGILNLKIGDVFNVERKSETPIKRQDLGFLGNQIREYAGSEYSKNVFENYWNGGGDIELSSERFAGILLDIKNGNGISRKNRSNDTYAFTNNEGQTKQYYACVYSFYESKEYSLVYGSATMYTDEKERFVGFYDTYDFDSKKWGERSVKNELKTRAVRYASPKTAKSFDIRYGYSKR